VSKSYRIEVIGLEEPVVCTADQSVLEAVRQAGWELPYSCNAGLCASCKGRVLSGRVASDRAGDHALSDSERAQGMALFCQARPLSDLVIEPRTLTRIDPLARRRVAARVMRLDWIARDVVCMKLRFPAGEKVRFQAGQYLQVLLPGGERRSYSMANPPQQNDGAELHIRVLPDGAFSQFLSGGLAVGDTVEVELPHGDFHWREQHKGPVVMLASGTGFAPLKSMLEDAFRRGLQREISLYWGARTPSDLYLINLARDWATNRGIRFEPVISESTAGDGWQGRTGLVHEAVLADHASLAEHVVYACGAPPMVAAARHEFIALRNLPPDAFFCDAFAVATRPTAALAD
jgi:NAD(P)H-flavin reductase/ferredoxin